MPAHLSRADESGSRRKEISAAAEPWRLGPVAPIVGHWEDGRFVVCDGRHDYLAALMIGRDKLFVCWLEATPEAIPDLRDQECDACPPEREISGDQVTPEAEMVPA